MGLILIVEDDVDIAEHVSEFLTEEGHTVVVAQNGQEALRLLETSERPCVIILDLMMPIMDGWAVLDELNRDATHATIPVVITSAVLDVKVKQHAKAALRKPYDTDDLLGLVERFCGAAGRPALTPN
jgi:CheY-like chemotaxis protein